VKMLERMIRGQATPIDLETVSSVQTNIIGNCLCVLGDSMAMPVGAMVKKYRDEFMEAIEHGVPGATLGAPSGEPAIVPPGARSQPMPARAGAVA
jgi:NADH-quinone oxidoreductase subunit F